MSENSENAIRALKECFPARADFLIGHLRDWNRSAKRIPEWREEQLIKFLLFGGMNADELERGYREKRITKIAWAARNLLELTVWVDYCNLSEAHAKRLRDDLARDLLGFSGVIQLIYAEAQGSPAKDLDEAMAGITRAAEHHFDVVGIDGNFKKIVEAAEETGQRNKFVALNKMFSKYAHPTALAMNSVLEGVIAADQGIREMFLGDGVDAAIGIFVKIRDFVVQRFPVPLEAAADER